MALESATYISDLNSSNPTAGDPASQGDDHLRLVKSTVKATFPNVSGAVTPTHTELNYVDGVTSAIQTQLDRSKATNGTATVSTSGTAIDFNSIPSWVKRITVNFSGVSTSGTSAPSVQIGDAGGIEATGYLGTATTLTSAATSSVNLSSGFTLNLGTASNVMHGTLQLILIDASTFTWAAQGNFGLSSSATTALVSGSKALSATLDRVRITTANGTDTFDAGVVNIQMD